MCRHELVVAGGVAACAQFGALLCVGLGGDEDDGAFLQIRYVQHQRPPLAVVAASSSSSWLTFSFIFFFPPERVRQYLSLRNRTTLLLGAVLLLVTVYAACIDRATAFSSPCNASGMANTEHGKREEEEGRRRRRRRNLNQHYLHQMRAIPLLSHMYIYCSS